MVAEISGSRFVTVKQATLRLAGIPRRTQSREQHSQHPDCAKTHTALLLDPVYVSSCVLQSLNHLSVSYIAKLRPSPGLAGPWSFVYQTSVLP